MNRIILLLLISFFLFSCDDLGLTEGKEEPNKLSGSGDIPMAQVGNKFSISPQIGGKYYELNENMVITKNENGLITVDVEAPVPNIPELKTFIDRIPSNLIKDGKVKTTFKFKITDKGIQDFFNKDGKAHTLVKYDAKVGDEYKLTKSDGKTITRKVVARSTTDEFPYGFYYIKVITVEQDSRIAGIKKFVFRANHKFGLVHVEAHLDDGTIVKLYVYSKF